MKYSVKLIVYIFAAILIFPTSAMAAKEKFERNKPHVNVGTGATQMLHFLMHAPAEPGSSSQCYHFGTLTGQEIIPDKPAALFLVAEDIEMGPGDSFAIPVKIPPSDSAASESTADRREFSIEFEEDENPPASCPLMTAVVGYNSGTQATEYYISSVTHHISRAPDSNSGPDDKLVFAFPVGFVGGNGDQFARFILDPREATDADSQNNGPGVQCDLSGTLRVRTVRVWGDPYVSLEQDHLVELQQGRVILDSDFNELGAGPDTRVDVIAFYEFDVPFKLGVCANFLDFSIQIIDEPTGETAAGMKIGCHGKVGYCPQFY